MNNGNEEVTGMLLRSEKKIQSRRLFDRRQSNSSSGTTIARVNFRKFGFTELDKTVSGGGTDEGVRQW